MSLNAVQIHRALWGAVRFARFDPVGLAVFGDRDLDFWQSFFAAVIVAPMFFLWVLMHGTGMAESVPVPLAYLYEFTSYGVGWLLFPAIAYTLCRTFDRTDRYVRYVVAYNWSSVIQNALFFLLNVPTALGLLSGGARSFLGLILLIYVLIYGWFIAKTALGVDNHRAAMFVAVDFAVSLFWERFTDSLVAG